MSRRLLTGAVSVLAALAWLSVPINTQVRDLDSLDDGELQRDLEAELDDIYEDLDEDTEYPFAELKNELLEALGDQGDDGDEDDISFAALQQEMAEDQTTLDDVLNEALAEADEIATRESRTWKTMLVTFPIGSAVQRRGNGRTTPRQAVLQATRSISQAVRAK